MPSVSQVLVQAKAMTVYVTIGEQNMQCEVQRGSRVSDVKCRVKEQNPNVEPSQMHMTYKVPILLCKPFADYC